MSQIEYEHIPQYISEARYCLCGTRLSGYNHSSQCSLCRAQVLTAIYEKEWQDEVRKEQTFIRLQKNRPARVCALEGCGKPVVGPESKRFCSPTCRHADKYRKNARKRVEVACCDACGERIAVGWMQKHTNGAKCQQMQERKVWQC